MKPRFFERLSLFAVLVCFALLCAVGARAQETGADRSAGQLSAALAWSGGILAARTQQRPGSDGPGRC